MAVLDGNTSHPSATDVFDRVAESCPAIALATVYNTLDALAKRGMLRELPITKDKLNYDPDMSAHDHAYCSGCGKIFDVFEDAGESGTRETAPIKGAKLISISRVYYIECEDCGTKRKKPESSKHAARA